MSTRSPQLSMVLIVGSAAVLLGGCYYATCARRPVRKAPTSPRLLQVRVADRVGFGEGGSRDHSA